MIEIEKIPTHVGIIMDGNGRWAQMRSLPRIEGHRRGAERAREVIKAASDAGVKVLTLYTFSVENWQRPQDEVSILMKILQSYLERELDGIDKENIRFMPIGETWRLPTGIQVMLDRFVERTSKNTGMILVPALSYSGRNDILRAAKKAISMGLSPETLTEDQFALLMDTAGLPPVDLIIRTSGEKRISNFLLWESAYAELYFTETLWPDFTTQELLRAIRDYENRERRFGAVPVNKAK